jgi:hypothetical protein
MWITVENERVFGDFQLGISQALVKGFQVSGTFPHLSPQLFTNTFTKKAALVWEEICNYKKVIRVTHLLTAVITTNFKYKTFSWRVRSGFNPGIKQARGVGK